MAGPTAAATAAKIAPILERLRSGIARRVPEVAGDLVATSGAGPDFPVLAMLRNLPGRSATLAALREVFIYQAAVDVEAALAALAAADLVTVERDVVTIPARGVEVLTALHRRTDELVAELWAGNDDRVADLLLVVDRVVEAAAATGGPAFGVVAPVWEPPGALPAMRLAERLTPLRFHRFDAHIAAWRAAGLRVEEIEALGPGPARDAIEADTDRSSAPPYEVLTPVERRELLAGLDALPT